MSEEIKKCAHPACQCAAPKDGEYGDYCSTYCHDAKGTMELSCNCGHPGCSLS